MDTLFDNSIVSAVLRDHHRFEQRRAFEYGFDILQQDSALPLVGGDQQANANLAGSQRMVTQRCQISSENGQGARFPAATGDDAEQLGDQLSGLLGAVADALE